MFLDVGNGIAAERSLRRAGFGSYGEDLVEVTEGSKITSLHTLISPRPLPQTAQPNHLAAAPPETL